MFWLTWRRHRAYLLTTMGIVLALFAIWVLVLIDVSGCAAEKSFYHCHAPLHHQFDDKLMYYVMGLVLMCVILGAIGGALLFAREYEEHTHTFVITQNGRYRHWITTKIMLVATPVIIAITGLGIASAHWHDHLGLRFPLIQGMGYLSHGLLPAAQFTVVFALATLIGVLSRRTLTTMVIAVLAFVPITLATNAIRPLVIPPERITIDITDTDRAESGQALPTVNAPDNTTPVATEYLDINGDTIDIGICNEPECKTGVVTTYTDYYHNSDFWTLQAFDTVTYVVIAALALGAAVWVLARRQL